METAETDRCLQGAGCRTQVTAQVNDERGDRFVDGDGKLKEVGLDPCLTSWAQVDSR